MSEHKHQNAAYFTGFVCKSNQYEEGYVLRTGQSGISCLSINLCCKEEYVRDGDAKTKTTYVPIVAFGQKAQEWADAIKLYSTIKVKASYNPRSYTTGSGETRYTHEFVANSLEVLENGSGSVSAQSSEAPAEEPAVEEPAVEETATTQTATATEEPAAEQEEVDDIPF